MSTSHTPSPSVAGLIPIEHVAYLEPFDNADTSRFQTDKPFLTRVVLLDRESVLTEDALVVVSAFAAKAASSGKQTCPLAPECDTYSNDFTQRRAHGTIENTVRSTAATMLPSFQPLEGRHQRHAR